MNDTPPDVDRKYREMLLRCSGAERLRMGCSLHATARTLVVASVLASDPHASAARLRREIFLRFYRHEFNSDSRAKILAALSDSANPTV